MSNHDKLIAAINDLYSVVVALPDEMPSTLKAGDESLRKCLEVAQGQLDEVKSWEGENSALVKLAREAAAAKARRQAAETSIKLARRALQVSVQG